MRAWVFKKSGEPQHVLKLLNDWPHPTPKDKQILINVKAVSLNPIGWKAMGVLPISLGQKKPCVPEADVAGIVAGGDLSGTDLKEGDEVVAFIPYDTILKSGQGALAEYTLAQPHLVVKKPSNLSFAEGCSFPLAGLTAYQALVKSGGLKDGGRQRIFINGGSGGVGAYAIQIAKAYGAFVVTTTSPASKDLVSSFNPDVAIDYKSEDLTTVLKRDFNAKEGKGFDIVFDSVGVNAVYDQARHYLNPKGTFVDIAGPHIDGSIGSLLSAAATLAARFIRPTLLGGNPVKYNFIMLQGSTADKELREGVDLLAKGTIKPVVDQTFPFADVHKAYERSKSGRAKGKVVVLVD